jgi:hypothetical protein
MSSLPESSPLMQTDFPIWANSDDVKLMDCLREVANSDAQIVNHPSHEEANDFA